MVRIQEGGVKYLPALDPRCQGGKPQPEAEPLQEAMVAQARAERPYEWPTYWRPICGWVYLLLFHNFRILICGS